MKAIDEAKQPLRASSRARTLTPEDVSCTLRAPSSLLVVLGPTQAQRMLEGPHR